MGVRPGGGEGRLAVSLEEKLACSLLVFSVHRIHIVENTASAVPCLISRFV